MLLMIDNYDSFTFNLVQYFGELGADVRVVRNDEITVAERSRQMGFVQENAEASKRRRVSPWLEMNPENFTGSFIRVPARQINSRTTSTKTAKPGRASSTNSTLSQSKNEK